MEVTDWAVPLGVICAAIITGAVTFVNMVISKEAKVSEFRQQWIDALRTEITTYISRVLGVVSLGQYISHKDSIAAENSEQISGLLVNNVTLMQERSRLYIEALEAYNAIHLRINKQEKGEEHQIINDKFIEALEHVNQFYKDGTQDFIEDGLTKLREAGEPLLKKEWERVKKGERAYIKTKRAMKILGISASVIFVIGIIYLVFNLS